VAAPEHFGAIKYRRADDGDDARQTIGGLSPGGCNSWGGVSRWEPPSLLKSARYVISQTGPNPQKKHSQCTSIYTLAMVRMYFFSRK